MLDGPVIPGTNYCGLNRGYARRPRNKVDWLCYQHDKAYERYLKAGKNPYLYWNSADEMFVYQLRKLPMSVARGLAETFFSGKKLLYYNKLTGVLGDPVESQVMINDWKRVKHTGRKRASSRGVDEIRPAYVRPDNESYLDIGHNNKSMSKGEGNLGGAISARKRFIDLGPVKFVHRFKKVKNHKEGKANQVSFWNLQTGYVSLDGITTGVVPTANAQGWYFTQPMSCMILSRFLFTPRYFAEFIRQQSTVGSTGFLTFTSLIENSFTANTASIKSIFALPTNFQNIVSQGANYVPYGLGTGGAFPGNSEQYFRMFFSCKLKVKHSSHFVLRNNHTYPAVVECLTFKSKFDTVTSQVDFPNEVRIDLEKTAVVSFARDNWDTNYYSTNPVPSAIATPSTTGGEIVGSEFSFNGLSETSPMKQLYYLSNRRVVRLEAGEETKISFSGGFTADLLSLVERLRVLGYVPLTLDGTTNHPSAAYVLKGIDECIVFKIRGTIAHDYNQTASVYDRLNVVGYGPAGVDIKQEDVFSFSMNGYETDMPPNRHVDFANFTKVGMEVENAPLNALPATAGN